MVGHKLGWISRQLELFMVIHLLTRKQNQQRRLKNNYE
jgi:hypothetical protein